MENAISREELTEMWRRPPERQIAVAQSKILEAIHRSGNKVMISWSGGKDSTLLLFLYCKIVTELGLYEGTPIDVVFADTTNESRGIYDFIKFFPAWLRERFGVELNLIVVKPEKCYIDENHKRKRKPVTMVDVVREFGIPMISKETARRVHDIRKSMYKNGIAFSQIQKHLEPTIENRDYLKALGLGNMAVSHSIGWSGKRKGFSNDFLLARKWLPLLWDDAPIISMICCDYLKKRPIAKVKCDGVIMTGEMAEESELRKRNYLKTGCNGAISPDGTGKSKPFGAMTEQGLLFGLQYYSVPIASDYGEIVEDEGRFKCSLESRTGCVLCGFGIAFDGDRFVRLQRLEPAKIKYAFTPKEQGGLGYLEVCEFLNRHCKCKIAIPRV